MELARSAGLELDEWQAFVLERALGQVDGRWAAFEIGVEVSRQNGKGAILEARELAGLFLLEERLVIHSAHQFDTSLEAFRRLLWLIEETPDLDKQVKRVSRSHGEEGIELRNGCRIRFRTRTKGGGRGFSSDCLILDEAMVLAESSHGALLPTLSARPNPQVWYTGSAVDQLVHDDGVVFARIRERGIKGDSSLAYFEWSLDTELGPDQIEGEAEDQAAWAQANPGLGIRIAPEHVEYERKSMDSRTFAVERLGVGDWPATDGASHVIDLDVWDALKDSGSRLQDPVVFAYDISPDRSSAAIAAAGKRGDGLAHLEVVEHRKGVGWVVPRLRQLNEKWRPAAVLYDAAGSASSLAHDLREDGVPLQEISARDHANACGLIFDLVTDEGLRHLGSLEIRSALKGAAKRPLGEAWAWSRKSSSVDITPLVAGTIALWGSETAPEGDYLVDVAAYA